ncbi:MAG: cyanophycinase [Vicinamibacterales bacterium]
MNWAPHVCRPSLRLVLSAIVVLLALTPTARVEAAEGHLVLVGGGPTPAQVFGRTLALSGGHSAIVAVLPQTFPTDTIADAAVTMWTTFKAREVAKVSRTDPEAARALLERATLIWMPGGFPSLLMHTIVDGEIPAIIRARFAAGVTIGGASAGAMAMSTTMIADESTPDGRTVNGPDTEAGLGLWPEAIVSAHFTERRRLGPLADIVREHPTLFGVGIDEGTAVFVSKGEFEVLGQGTVVIVNAQNRPVRTLRSGMRIHYRSLLEPHR